MIHVLVSNRKISSHNFAHTTDAQGSDQASQRARTRCSNCIEQIFRFLSGKTFQLEQVILL